MIKKINYLLLVFIIFACSKTTVKTSSIKIESPNKVNKITFGLNKDNKPYYLVNHNSKQVIDTSYINFEFKNQPELNSNLRVVNSAIDSLNEKWEMPWGEQRYVTNNYKELKVQLEEITSPKRKFNIIFRTYDDGVAFRYYFPEQKGVDSLMITDENTEFQLTKDYKTWWLPGDWDNYEHFYYTSKLSNLKAKGIKAHNDSKRSKIPENAVNTPVTMRSDDGLHLSFHEANLTNYSGMTLKVDTVSLKLTSELVGSDRLGYKVSRKLPFYTPWRTIQIANKASELVDSRLILNLNEPSKLDDMSWFTPMKYIGVWWEMHLRKSKWHYGMTRDSLGNWIDNGKGHGMHGATTENTKRYIDFAAENGFKAVLVEGWNTGWERWIGFEDRERVFDFVTPYPDYDLKELAKYGKEKDVQIMMHHETSAAPRTYEKQLDTAFALMRDNGITSVKTGYVGRLIPKGEYHHGQWMVNHYRKVIETAAKYNVAINTHEPIKPTGVRRTYPNAISREGLRGQEFNAWAKDGGNPPNHLPIVAFTRMLAGPIDFTPGVFDINLTSRPDNQVNTTLAKQLALYVVIYSPIQMACDLPENYTGNPAFQFIKDVGVDWEKSITLNGEVGEFVTIARQEKETLNWFVGGISDENSRTIPVDFDFLEDNTTYDAVIYKDGKNAHFKNNPTEVIIEKIKVVKGNSISIDLAAGGGFAISLKKQ